MSASFAIHAPHKFVASVMQTRFFDWVETGTGSAILKAVAGSGKSTSIVRALPYITREQTVLIMAFNAPIAKEMRDKIAALGLEIGRTFQNVEAATFHSRGFRALTKRWGQGVKVEVDSGKVRKILKDRLSEAEYEMYGDFVDKLVGFAKGLGVGVPGMSPDERGVWFDMIAMQELWLDDESASEDRAVEIARKALCASNSKAEKERWIDFNDQLYLPLLWNLKMFRHDWIFVDELQDTNPVRREFAKRCLKSDPKCPGRFVGVGDPCQSIYAFTGASTNAMDLIAEEFNTIELPLTVSYRCPKAVGEIARQIVPYFEVADNAPQGEVATLPLKDVLAKLSDKDMILCRQTAPLISLAFQIIAGGRGCVVLGKDVGAGLVKLIKMLRPKGVPNLVERLEAFREKQVAKFTKAEQFAKAEAEADRVQCVLTVIDALGEGSTVPAVIERVEALFGTGSEDRLTLSTIHKAKGREAMNVAVYRQELSPSKATKSDEAYDQELHLIYVRDTRTMNGLYFIEGEGK